MVEFRILGPLEVLEHGRTVLVGGPKARALLAVLLLHRGEVVSTDRLIDALWGERASATAAKTVHVYVSNLRKALGEGLLVTRGHGYLLQTEPGQVDLDRFEVLVAEGRRLLASGDARAAGERLREALTMWRGPPLGEFAYELFARNAITRLEAVHLEALKDRIDADLAAGELAGLVAELEALVQEHPLRERLQGQLMLALYRSERQVEALDTYRAAQRLLVDELGLDPGLRLQELERAILAHDPALEPPSRASGPRPPPADVARKLGRGGRLLAAAGALLLAALVAAAVKLSGAEPGSVQVPANSVAVIDAGSNRVVGAVAVGGRPGAVVFGSGSLWVANLDDQIVSRIDPGPLRTLRTFSFAGPPTGLAAGAGAVWVAQSNRHAPTVSVTAIDPQLDLIGATKTLGNYTLGGAAAVATTGKEVWVAPSSGLLTRLDSTTERTVWHRDPETAPAAIAVGDGATWLTDTERDKVIRVGTTGRLASIPIGNGPTGIAVGEGGVWVADSLDDRVTRINPGTRSATGTIRVGRSPTGVAVGAGSVWVANSGDGTVTRIDPHTDRIQANIAVGGSPQAITIADGRAWVTVDAQTIPPADVASARGTLRVESQLAVDSMDPALADAATSWQLLNATCAKLLNYRDASGPTAARLVPEVAQALPARSPDGKTYTFTIRPGFRFSPPSNEPVTAQTFKDTIERTLNPRMQSPVAHEFEDIVGSAAYVAGKAPDIAGIVVRGDQLTIHLVAPAPDLLTRIAEPAGCAVPSKTPVDPSGTQTIPSAGPYYATSYDPSQGIVLERNPNYRSTRPHRLQRIEFAVGVSNKRALADVKAGTADYTRLSGPGAANLRSLASQLAARYGPESRAAKRGAQQYFAGPELALDYFVLNTHRPLFGDARMRKAVSYAIDRRSLAQLGNGIDPLPDRPADHYLPPGMPGYRDTHVYPLMPDPAKARALAQGTGRTAVLYTCDVYPCTEQAQILKADLAAIGLHLRVRSFSYDTMFAREQKPGQPFDIGFYSWADDNPDPAGMLPLMLDYSRGYTTLSHRRYERRLAAIARLTGLQRYLAYGKLDIDIARNDAPLVAYGNPSSSDFFSARIGCQSYSVYGGIDLAALCLKHESHQ